MVLWFAPDAFAGNPHRAESKAIHRQIAADGELARTARRLFRLVIVRVGAGVVVLMAPIGSNSRSRPARPRRVARARVRCTAATSQRLRDGRRVDCSRAFRTFPWHRACLFWRRHRDGGIRTPPIDRPKEHLEMRFVHAAMTALCLFTLTASTALAQKVTTDYDKAANFASKTYSWIKEPKTSNPLMRQRIVEEINGALRGPRPATRHRAGRSGRRGSRRDTAGADTEHVLRRFRRRLALGRRLRLRDHGPADLRNRHARRRSLRCGLQAGDLAWHRHENRLGQSREERQEPHQIG